MEIAQEVLDEKSKSKILIDNYYSGNRAQRYEQSRSQNPKWNFEQDTVVNLLTGCIETNPEIKSVIDVPVGTNRFSELIMGFSQIEKAYGIDYSVDMLEIASKKGAGKYEFIRHDIFSHTLCCLADIVLCLRFLNLFPWEDSSKAIANAAKMAREYLILAIRLVDGNYSGPTLIENKIFLHYKADFYHLVQSLNFSVASRHIYHDDIKPGKYIIFLLRRQTMGYVNNEDTEADLDMGGSDFL